MPPPQGSFNPIEGPGDYTVTKTVHSDTYAAIDPSKVNHAGHAVLVTGGTRGLGKAMVLSFAKSGASHIAATGRAPKPELAQEIEAAATKAGHAAPQVLLISLELDNPASMADAAAKVEAEWGRLDIVVHNAGVMSNMTKLADSDADNWWWTISVNLRGPYLTYKHFVPLLLKSKGLATIVTVSSVGAHIVSPGLSAYQISKLALVRLTEFATAEYADEGLLTFTVHPGNILTDMASEFELSEEFKKVFTETPEISADTISFLTAERQTWLNGRYVNCTWDMPELLAQKDEIVAKDRLKVKLDVW